MMRGSDGWTRGGGAAGPAVAVTYAQRYPADSQTRYAAAVPRGELGAGAHVGGGFGNRANPWTGDVVMRAETIGPAAYVADDTGFPKDGTASPCVARQ